MDYLTWPDYLVLVAFFVISLGIGVYHSLTGGRQKTTSEFIMANRALKVIPTSVSLLVSFQSAITILGMTAETYSYGSMYLVWTPITMTVAIFLVMQVAIPWLYPLKLVSVNEYLDRRFRSKSVRILGSLICVLYAVLVMGTGMFAPSAALESATGIPILFSVPVMAVVSIVYTALGGMRAVIWTDVFQSVIIYGGLLTILIKGLIVVGGVGSVIQLSSQSGRLNWIDWSPDPTVRHTFWGFTIGYSIAWFGMYGISQGSVQRYSATKSLTQAKLTMFLNLPAFIVLHLIMCFTGVVVVAYFASIRCDPLVNREISNANQLLPRFVLQMFVNAPGFSGIFLAALYGGALSSVSTFMSGSAANIWEDILQWKLMHWTESRKALLNRFLVVLLGVAATGFAFVASAISGPITQVIISLNGAISGPFYGMFLLGGLNRYANWKGALIGAITSISGSFWLTIGSFTMKRRSPTFLPPLSVDGCMKPSNLTFPDYRPNEVSSTSSFYFIDESGMNTTLASYLQPPTDQPVEVPMHGLEKFYSISYLWYNLLWMVVTLIVGSIASYLLRDRTEEEALDEKLLINFRQFFRFRHYSKSDSDPRVLLSLVNCQTEVVPKPAATEIMKEPMETHSETIDEEKSYTDRQTTALTNGKRDAQLLANAEISKP